MMLNSASGTRIWYFICEILGISNILSAVGIVLLLLLQNILVSNFMQGFQVHGVITQLAFPQH